MKMKPYFISLSFLIFCCFSAKSQEIFELDLNKSIEIAKDKSFDMLQLKQDLSIATYNLRAATNRFKTNMNIDFKIPDYNESMSQLMDSTGLHYFPVRTTSYSSNLNINQPLPTDGNVYIRSGVSNTDDLITSRRSFLYGTRVGVTQPIEALYIYNNIRSEFKKAKLNYEMSFKSLKRAELDLVYNVSNSFYGLVSASERKGIALQTLKRQEEAFQIAKNKYDAGLIREVEELQMEVDLGAAQNDFDIAVVNYESMLNNFKQQIGISLQDSVILKRDTAYNIVAIDGEKAIQLGLENRLEIREKEIRIELSNLDIKKNKSNGMIKGEISAYYDFTGISNSDRTLSFRNAFDNSWTDLQNRPTNRGIYFSIYVPLLDWGVNRSLVKAAKAYKIKNENALEFQKISIENEIRNLVKQTLSSLKRLQLLEKNVTVAERNFEISKSRFRNGDIDGQALALDRARLNGAYISKLEAFISYKLLLADLARKTFYDFEKNKSLLE
jgi:outer membrane protein TolC